MKICFVIQNLGYGGAERVAINLVDSWIKLNHEVFFIFTSTKPNNTYPNDFKHYYLSRDKKINPLLKIRKTIKILKMEKPDIVVSFLDMPNFIASVACNKLNIPIICSERNNPALYPKNRLVRMLRKIAYKKANAVVFQTSGAKNYFNKKIQNKSCIIVNPVTNDLSKLKLNNKESSRDFNFVAIGRLCEQKNHMMMIKSFKDVIKHHDNARLLIYGDGPDKDAIQSFIIENQLEKHVKLLGIKNIDEIYKNASAFLMSSNYEGYPNALVEALCIGVPCVCTDCPSGGPHDLKKDNQSLLLTPVNDSRSFTSKILFLIENYENLYKNALEKRYEYLNIHNPNYIANLWIDIMKQNLI